MTSKRAALPSSKATPFEYLSQPTCILQEGDDRPVALGKPWAGTGTQSWGDREVTLADIFLQNAVAIRVTQLTERLGLNLTNPLTGHVENLADLFQGLHPAII